MEIRSTWLRTIIEHLIPCATGRIAEEVRLEHGAVWVIPERSAEVILLCEEGEIWITQEGEEGDRILGAGGGCRLLRKGQRVVQAFAPSKIVVCGIRSPELRLRRTDPGEWLRLKGDRLR